MNYNYQPMNEHLSSIIKRAIEKLEDKYDRGQEKAIEVSDADELLLEAIANLHEKVSIMQEQLETQQQLSPRFIHLPPGKNDTGMTLNLSDIADVVIVSSARDRVRVRTRRSDIFYLSGERAKLLLSSLGNQA